MAKHAAPRRTHPLTWVARAASWILQCHGAYQLLQTITEQLGH
jgi:hypothetical protein